MCQTSRRPFDSPRSPCLWFICFHVFYRPQYHHRPLVLWRLQHGHELTLTAKETHIKKYSTDPLLLSWPFVTWSSFDLIQLLIAVGCKYLTDYSIMAVLFSWVPSKSHHSDHCLDCQWVVTKVIFLCSQDDEESSCWVKIKQEQPRRRSLYYCCPALILLLLVLLIPHTERFYCAQPSK